MIVNENIIVEIVRPGTGDPVADGEVGEVVVTSFNPDYPMIRLATGDLSAVLPGVSPCGRTNMRIKGWMGRADQTAKVKGMFVHPKQVAEVAARHPELGRLRLVVGRDAEQDTHDACWPNAPRPMPRWRPRSPRRLQSVTKLKGAVKLVAPGSLPNDGKVIADERPVGCARSPRSAGEGASVSVGESGSAWGRLRRCVRHRPPPPTPPHRSLSARGGRGERRLDPARRLPLIARMSDAPTAARPSGDTAAPHRRAAGQSRHARRHRLLVDAPLPQGVPIRPPRHRGEPAQVVAACSTSSS